MEMRLTGDSQPVPCVVDLWLIALKPASSEQEFRGCFLSSLPPLPLKRSLELLPSTWRLCLMPSVKEILPNNAEIMRICVHFSFSWFSVKILPFRSVAATISIPFSCPHPSKGRVESLSPCPLLPQTLPSGSPPLQFPLPLSSHSGCRRLAQRSKKPDLGGS